MFEAATEIQWAETEHGFWSWLKYHVTSQYSLWCDYYYWAKMSLFWSNKSRGKLGGLLESMDFNEYLCKSSLPNLAWPVYSSKGLGCTELEYHQLLDFSCAFLSLPRELPCVTESSSTKGMECRHLCPIAKLPVHLQTTHFVPYFKLQWKPLMSGLHYENLKFPF